MRMAIVMVMLWHLQEHCIPPYKFQGEFWVSKVQSLWYNFNLLQSALQI